MALIVVVCVLVVMRWSTSEGFENPYSFIADDIAQGNPISMSGAINPRIEITEKDRRNPIIYQAHGSPLLHETKATDPAKTNMFYFEDYSCRPECCLYSPYSCSNGCVCWQPPLLTSTQQNSRISPRS